MRKLLYVLFGLDFTPTFRYKYLRHPFDDVQYFSIRAADQATANTLAVERFTEMFNNRETVMKVFWPV